MVRKGKLQEVLSKAMHADDPRSYTVGYRDFNEIKELPLPDFLELADNFQIIPASRIVYIRKDDEVLYRKLGTRLG